MDKQKEMLKLTEQAIRVLKKDSSIRTAQLEPTVVGAVAVINNYDANAFSQAVYEKAAELEKQGMQVEIQFSTSYYSNPAGFVLMYSALLVGRKHANSKIG